MLAVARIHFMENEVRIIKKADDPLCPVRVSIGGDPDVDYYCVYRGTKEGAIHALRMALYAMEGMAKQLREMGETEPELSPEDPAQTKH